MSRFAVRVATQADAEGIAYAHVESWETSYRGVLPDGVLDRIDVGQRVESRRRLRGEPGGRHHVAYHVTHRGIVGVFDAGESRRPGPYDGEVYALYLLHRAKRYGLGREMVERTMEWLPTRGMRSLIIWVLENNHHARRFYEAMGGRAGARIGSAVGGYPVVEVAYVWDRL
jgi:GNAT superfamily N-acetyltransferase